MKLNSLIFLPLLIGGIKSLSLPQTNQPQVTLGEATFIGSTKSKVESFKAISFAEPPLGELRLREPRSLKKKPSGTIQATKEPPSCYQLKSTFPENDLTSFVHKVNSSANPNDVLSLVGHGKADVDKPDPESSEDCLYLNVYRPEGTSNSTKLPVVIWIYGGAYQTGSTTSKDPTKFVAESAHLNKHVIYVNFNYRLAGFGFLNGKAVKENGVANIGLLDQQAAFSWVQENIAAFGGDPSKVSLWGQSAGSMAIGMHLVSEGKEETALYRAVLMDSGSPYRIGRTEDSNLAFDIMAKASGCSNEDSKIAFDCLQGLPLSDFLSAMNSVPPLLSYEGCTRLFVPSVDGTFLPDYPDKLIKEGSYKKQVNILSGNQDDEGTLHTIVVVAKTNTASKFEKWVKEVLLVGLSDSDFEEVARLYPQDPTQGAPYDTGLFNTVTSQNKRIASVYTDVTFQSPRRSFLSTVSKTNPTWSYLDKNLKGTPYLGAFHGSELLNLYGNLPGPLTREMQARWISFINDGNPNLNSSISNFLGLGTRTTPQTWPTYETNSREILVFDGLRTEVGNDNFRKEEREFLTALAEEKGIRQIS